MGSAECDKKPLGSRACADFGQGSIHTKPIDTHSLRIFYQSRNMAQSAQTLLSQTFNRKRPALA
jgi:hypothetical protein